MLSALFFRKRGQFRLRRIAEAKNWLCHKCKYDLRGSFTSVCPECGTQIPEGQKQRIMDAMNLQSEQARVEMR
jgi:rubrerythrin